MIINWLEKIKGKELRLFSIITTLLLFGVSFLLASPAQIGLGMKEIILSRDALITDYFELAGYGAAFFNAGLVLGLEVWLVIRLKVPFTGLTMAAFFINVGYALWGKNPVNIIPILLGTVLYARLHRAGLNRYIYTALFGTSLAPFVTEMVFLLPFPYICNLLSAIGLGIFIGFVLPPLSMHTASMHMGYNLFNVGFSAGTLAFVLVCVLESFGLQCNPVFIWREGRHAGIMAGLYLYFAMAFLFGLLISRGRLQGIWKIMRHPGRAVADFVMMDGAGTTLMNMGLIGLVGTTYILMIGGDFSGPVVGAIFTAFGFAAFGAHLKNYLPVLAGVFLSTFISQSRPETPGIQLAAMFAVGLAPIAGQFGPVAGIIAGMLHSAIVMCTSQMYGGLNLYNNGFSAGWVAIVMVPVLESFMKHFEDRKRRKTAEKG